MFPAFRVKGIWPTARKSSGTHPVTGVPLSNFELTDTVLQLPLSAYDDIVERYPESRLKYFDEDKDEVTVGSKLELAAKLREPISTGHNSSFSRSDDPIVYTRNPEFLHGFHIDDTDAARKAWPFFAANTILRNQPARDLWTGAVRVPANDLSALLNEHAYDFMAGYEYESISSKPSSNTGPQAWERILDLHSQAKRAILDSKKPLDTIDTPAAFKSPFSVPATPPALSSNTSVPPTTYQHSNPDLEDVPPQSNTRTDGINMVARSSPVVDSADASEGNHKLDTTDRLSLAHEAITKDMASLHQALDERLEKAQALTRMLDKKPDLSAYQQKALTNATPSKESTAKSHPSTSIQPSSTPEDGSAWRSLEEIFMSTVGLPPVPPQYYRRMPSENTNKTGQMNQKVQEKKLEDQGPTFPNASAHLTDLGMKDSREAGMKLRNQLHAASTMITAVQEGRKTRQQVLTSFNPPKTITSAKEAEPTVSPTSSEASTSAGRKKSVRFSIPPFVSEEQISDGDFWSPGAQDLEPQTPSDDDDVRLDLESLKQTVLHLQENVQKQQAGSTLSDHETIKIRELIRIFDEYDGKSFTKVSRLYQEKFNPAALSVKPTEPTKSAVKAISTAVPAPESPQTIDDTKQDSVETTVTKLWCQTVEGIMSNVDSFAEQLEVHVKSQIAREQDTWTAALAENVPPQSLENDQPFLANARHSKDLITVQENVQGMINVLRYWHKACKNLMAPSELCSEQEIDTARVKKMNEQLRVMALSMIGSFEALYYTFVPAHDSTSTASSETVKQTRRIPRRYASKTGTSEVKTRSNKRYEKQSRPYRNVSFNHNSERKDTFPTKLDTPSAYVTIAESSDNSPAVISVDDLKDRNLAFNLPVASDSSSNPEPETPIAASQNQQPSRRFSWSSTDEAHVYRWQQSGLALDQQRPPKPTEFTKDSSDVLLSSFPPLVPQRESKRERHVSSQRSMPNLNSQRPVDHSQASSYYTWLDDTATGRPSQQESTFNPSRHSWHVGSNVSWPSVNPYSSHRPQSYVEPNPSGMPPVWEDNNGMDNIFSHSYNTSSNTQKHLPTAEELSAIIRAKETRQSRPAAARVTSSSAQTSSRRASAPEPNANEDVFHIFQDIPEHRDPKTANKILDCVEGLKDMGYGNINDGGDARLVVYAQAAKGNLMNALDIIEEERKAYREQGGISAYLLEANNSNDIPRVTEDSNQSSISNKTSGPHNPMAPSSKKRTASAWVMNLENEVQNLGQNNKNLVNQLSKERANNAELTKQIELFKRYDVVGVECPPAKRSKQLFGNSQNGSSSWEAEFPFPAIGDNRAIYMQAAESTTEYEKIKTFLTDLNKQKSQALEAQERARTELSTIEQEYQKNIAIAKQILKEADDKVAEFKDCGDKRQLCRAYPDYHKHLMGRIVLS